MAILKFLFEFFWLIVPASLFGCFLLALLISGLINLAQRIGWKIESRNWEE